MKFTKDLLVSILIPVYNCEKYIGETINSVLSQDYPYIEIIVVDDGSTDNSACIVDKFKKYGVFFYRQPNRGQCSAANVAYGFSNGAYIKFLDADDLLSPSAVSIQVRSLVDCTDKVAYGEWSRFYGDDHAMATFFPVIRPVISDPVSFLTQAPGLMLQCGLWLIPRLLLERCGGWDERLSLINDLEFMCRVVLASSGVCHTPGARLYYRSGLPSSLSAQKSRKALESSFLSATLFARHLLAAEDSPRTRLVCADTMKMQLYDYYPDHPDLVSKGETFIKDLGGSTYEYRGGKGFKLMSKTLGWKAAKRLRMVWRKIAYGSS